MSTTLEIQAALDTQLLTVTGLPVLQTENTRFDGSKNVPAFCRSTLLPAQTTVIGLGAGSAAQTQMQGLYQVDVFYPQDSGTTAARTLADAVVAVFPVGLRLVEGSSTVTVEVASVMTAYSINKYYCVPVRIQWNVYG